MKTHRRAPHKRNWENKKEKKKEKTNKKKKKTNKRTERGKNLGGAIKRRH